MRTDSEKSEQPIFIVGVHRSGTTLLRYMLNSSPRIYIPPESDFIPLFFGRKPEMALSQSRIEQLLNVIFQRYRFAKEWQGDPPVVSDFTREMEAPTPAAFLDTLYGMYARQFDAVRWGDKTPIYSSYVDLIARIFPDAQFIHIIRDGRDIALSMLEKWGQDEFHIDIYFTARNWVRRIRHAQASGARLDASRFVELRYEDLVREPVRVVRALCEFLGEPYLPEMSEPHRLGRARIEPDSFHSAIRQPPAADRVQRWRREMQPKDLRLFQSVAETLLAELGYPLAETGLMAAGERIRMAFLAAKYLGLQSGRRVLQTLGLFPPI